ncbi:MAG: Crp/Fnr family transcriptional regulator [Lachnospiraceae bacterium]|jgi:CRP-like cAMP-binding protein
MDNRDSFDIFLDDNSKYWFQSAYIQKLFRKSRYLVELDKKEILASPGDDLPECYYVDDGVIISYESDGKNRRVYDFFDKGMFIFLEETLMDYQCALTYEALTPVRLYSINAAFVKKLWKSNWMFANHSMKQMSRDYFLMRSLIRKETCHNADWRVSNILIELAVKEGTVQGEEIYLAQKHKKIHLANILHMNRVTFYKCFTNLEEADLCTIVNGRIVIKNLTRLKAYRDSLDRK